MRLLDGRKGAIGREKKRVGRQEKKRRKNSHHHYVKDERGSVLHLNLDLGQFVNRILFLYLPPIFFLPDRGLVSCLRWSGIHSAHVALNLPPSWDFRCVSPG